MRRVFLIIFWVLALSTTSAFNTKASDPFKRFKDRIEINGTEVLAKLDRTSNIRHRIFNLNNNEYAYIGVIKLLQQNRAEVTNFLRESDQRIQTFIEEEKAAAADDAKRAKIARFVSIVSQGINLVNAVGNLIHTIEQKSIEERQADFEEIFGDDWPETKNDFSEAFEDDFSAFPDEKEKAVLIRKLTQSESADEREVLLSALKKARLEGNKVEYIEKAIEFLDSNSPFDGSFSEEDLEKNREVINNSYRMLLSMSDTEADVFERNYKITVEDTAMDLADGLTGAFRDQDSKIPVGPYKYYAEALMFYFRPQVVGDSEPGGRAWRLWGLNKLNTWSKLYRDSLLNSNLKGYSDYINSLNFEIKENQMCHNSGCISMPK